MGLIARHIRKELIKEAVQVLNDEDRLLEIVKDDENIFEIRILATKQITCNNLLKEIIFDTSDRVYTKNNLLDIREIAVKQITDEETLEQIVNNYYDENVDTKYDLNIVKDAVNQISDEKLLLDIAESNYDKEITDIALEKVNDEFENLDKNRLIKSCDDDIKVKRMHAVENIDDEELLMDIAMNAKYMDVRQKALSKNRIQGRKNQHPKKYNTERKRI